MSEPPFSLRVPRYDSDTFAGRFKHFLDLADPRCLAPSMFFGVSLDQAVQAINSYKEHMPKVKMGQMPPPPEQLKAARSKVPYSDQELWLAKKIKTSAIHGDTGETIPKPFRMCGFAVFNTPILIGMLIPNPTLAATVFWMGANQTHNAFVNYFNRNASHPTPISTLVVGYVAAVASSVGISLGLNAGVKKLPISAAARTTLSRFVPYPAVAAASTANFFLMRRGELTSGIHVHDDDEVVRGTSQAAARSAILQTAVTRVVLPAPLLLIPPIVLGAIERFTPLFRKMPRSRLPVEAAVCATAFVFGLPFALALFPQEVAVPVEQLEPRFHNLVDDDGTKITTLYFNKGL
eukprot:m.486621 g.486621  ORF g.486621 m.486621 type:complete len:349 (+) comp24521_c0_seq1:95-1141(+)